MSVGGGSGTSSAAFGRQPSGGGGGVASQPKRAAAGRKKKRNQDAGRGEGASKTAAGVAAGKGKGKGEGPGTGTRDTFLSQFHALGKLLYAKRSPPDDSAGAAAAPAPAASASAAGTAKAAGGWPAGEGRRGKLEFVPEEVLSRGGMELDWAVAFLQYHCVDFFTDEGGEFYHDFFHVQQYLEYNKGSLSPHYLLATVCIALPGQGSKYGRGEDAHAIRVAFERACSSRSLANPRLCSFGLLLLLHAPCLACCCCVTRRVGRSILISFALFFLYTFFFSCFFLPALDPF